MSAPASSRGNPSMGDVVRSVIVLGLILLALYVASQFLFAQKPKTPVTPVDYVTAAASARQVAPYPLLAPRYLANGWYASAVSYDTGPEHAWHLYVVTKQQESIGLEQGTYSQASALKQFAPHSRARGTLTIAGIRWDRRLGTGSAKGKTILVRHDGAATTLVLGSASQAVVESYVASLSDTLPTPSPTVPSASPSD